MGGTTLMAWINGAEVIDDALQIPGWIMGWIGIALAGATVLSLDPSINGVLNVEQGTGVGPPAHTAQGDTKGVGDGMGQAPISTWRDVQQVKSALKEEAIECFALITKERIVREKLITDSLVSLKHAPGIKGAHIQLANPSILKNRLRQSKPQLGMG